MIFTPPKPPHPGCWQSKFIANDRGSYALHTLKMGDYGGIPRNPPFSGTARSAVPPEIIHGQ
jgi:hypothetical protein